ncbi:MAG: MFS transporter [Gammaproteobacteria bacterium]|nr:MFS transporter [Gammaproteobacteria bacterium]
MMVMPLGPDFALALDIDPAALGLVGGAYTFSAALAAILGALFLDRFDRRSALGLCMLGLSAATVGAAFAGDAGELIAWRLAAGLFGGPATSVAFSIVADSVPRARRGAALGAVMGAFSVASVLGVPAGLELARLGDWRTPFLAVGLLCLAVTVLVHWRLPAMTGHVARARSAKLLRAFGALLHKPTALGAYAMMATTMMASFLVLPNIPAYILGNLGYPREHMGLLYLGGGLLSFFVLRECGRLGDRFGAPRIAAAGTALFCLSTALFFLGSPGEAGIILLFAGLMCANSMRAVSMATVAAHVPDEHERAGFMSLRSAVQHLASSAGAGLSSLMLESTPRGGLDGMAGVGLLALVLSLFLPPLMHYVDRRLSL